MEIGNIWPVALTVAAILVGIALAYTQIYDRKLRRREKTCEECMAPVIERIVRRLDDDAAKAGEMYVYFKGTTRSQMAQLEEINRLCVEILRNGRR